VRLRFRAPERADAPAPVNAAATIEVAPGAVVLLAAAAPPGDVDDRVDATPPIRFAGEMLRGVRLEVSPSKAPTAVAAVAALVAGSPSSADAVLPEVGGDPGLRVLSAYSALALGRLPRVHAVLEGLGDDAHVGRLARFLVGAALLADGNPNEALRDLQAASSAGAAWPARLLQAFAEHRLGLHAEALASYDAVLAVVPGRAEAALGRAIVLARTDREAALASLRGLAARPETAAPAWTWIATIHGEGTTLDDVRAQAAALERLTSLRPRDAASWRALGGARFRLAEEGGAPAALAGAAEAYARETELAPDSGLAWFNLGAVLHRLAVAPPDDPKAARAGLAKADAAYARALETGLYGVDAARAHTNLAIVRVALGAPTADLASPAASLDAALSAEPTYAPAALERVALGVAAGDAEGAAKALEAAPESADAEDRALLRAAVSWLRGREGDVRAYVGRVAPSGPTDVLPTLAHLLTVSGWAVAARALIDPETTDARRLAERVRASARLLDEASVRRDLARLESADRAVARRLVETDRAVRVLSGR
jgi:hypothetical protein